jgi:hypothetical protein
VECMQGRPVECGALLRGVLPCSVVHRGGVEYGVVWNVVHTRTGCGNAATSTVVRSCHPTPLYTAHVQCLLTDMDLLRHLTIILHQCKRYAAFTKKVCAVQYSTLRFSAFVVEYGGVHSCGVQCSAVQRSAGLNSTALPALSMLAAVIGGIAMTLGSHCGAQVYCFLPKDLVCSPFFSLLFRRSRPRCLTSVMGSRSPPRRCAFLYT